MRATCLANLVLLKVIMNRDAQIPVEKSPWRRNFVWWRLILVDPQYVQCFMPPCWGLKFWDGPKISGTFVHPRSWRYFEEENNLCSSSFLL
jgi:hypothetical protein